MVTLFKIPNISKTNLFSSLRYYFYILVSIIIFSIVIDLLHIPLPSEKAKEDYPLLLFVFEILIIVPILEELSFRSYLNLKTRNMLLSLVFTVFFMIIAFFKDLEIIICLLILFLVYVSFLFLLVYRKKIRYSIITSKVLIFFGAIFFALLHVNKTENIDLLSIYTYIAIIPYFFVGVGLGYARIRLGLGYAILIHFLINLPSTLIFFLKTI